MTLLDGLVAYYKCDEETGNLIDATPNHNDLTAVNGPTFSPGVINNGVNLNRSTFQYFTRPHANLVGLNFTSDFTVRLYINMPSLPALNEFFTLVDKRDEDLNMRCFALGYGDFEAAKQFHMAITDVDDNKPWDLYNIPCELSPETKYHVVLKWKASTHTYTVKVNNLVVGTSTGTAGYTFIEDLPAPFRLGAYVATGNGNVLHGYNGMFDEIGFWNRLTTDQEDTELYSPAVGISYPFSSEPPVNNDPEDPPEGEHVVWVADGTGVGQDGDLMTKITNGGVTKSATLVDFSEII